MIIMIVIITMVMMLITLKNHNRRNFINKFSNNLKFTMYDLLER